MSPNYNEYFAGYLSLVEADNFPDVLHINHQAFVKLLSAISEDKANYRYAADKWSIKELTSHVIDSERIFAYRALRFARNDKTDLAGYDENHYGKFCAADDRLLADLLYEFDVTRQSSIALFRSFDTEMLKRSGTANNMPIDVKSLAYLIAGHCKHHINILQERYL